MTPVRGRTRGELLDELATMWRGVGGRSFVVSGAAGLGRTRLARVALARAAEAGHVTRWIAGATAAGPLPLGAVAHLLPPSTPEEGPSALLSRGVDALTAGARPGAPPIIAVDDAHLLDELSVALVLRLVISGAASVLLTVSTQHRAPEAVEALWKDGHAQRIDLGPLTRDEAEDLVAGELAGFVDSRTSEQLWRLTRGNPQFLQELLATGRETGSLVARDRLWRWEGPWHVSVRLRELVHRQWGDLTDPERTVLELLGLDDPLRLEDLVELSDPPVVAALERRGLLHVERGEHVARATLAHPLYAQVLRAEMPEVQARHLRRLLVRSRRATVGGAWRGPDLLRLARLELDLEGVDLDPALLVEAAMVANSWLDHPLAERLARAAAAAGAGTSAALALVEAVRWQGRASEAEEIAASHDERAAEAQVAAPLAISRALTLFFGAGRPDDAVAVLRSAAPPDDPSLDAVAALLGFFTGETTAAARAGVRILGSRTVSGPAAVWAAVTATLGLAMSGRHEAALDAVVRGRALLETLGDFPEVATVRLLLAHGELMALWVAGRTSEAEARARGFHDLAVGRSPSAGDAVVALLLGGVFLLAGRPPEAVRWLSEAAAGFGSLDPFGLALLCRTQLHQAHQRSGDPVLAPDPSAVPGPEAPSPAFAPFVVLSLAWDAAGRGDPDGAAALARTAAGRALATGQGALEASARHALVCFGRAEEVVSRLAELAEATPGPLLEAFAGHAVASSRRDGDGLDAVAADFAAMGCALLAVEAGREAARVHRGRGAARRAAAAATRAASIATERGIAGGEEPDRPPRLTARELEVTELAADGASNRAIAAVLILSVRTVETHLARAFVKLGVNRRSDLAAALPRPSVPVGRPVSP